MTAQSDRTGPEHRIKVWTRGGHVITGTVHDTGLVKDLRAELERLGRHVPAPVARPGLIEIPQGDGRAVQVVLEQVEAWSIEPERLAERQ